VPNSLILSVMHPVRPRTDRWTWQDHDQALEGSKDALDVPDLAAIYACEIVKDHYGS